MLQTVTLLAIVLVAVHAAANELPKVRYVMNKIHRNVGENGTGGGLRTNTVQIS